MDFELVFEFKYFYLILFGFGSDCFEAFTLTLIGAVLTVPVGGNDSKKWKHLRAVFVFEFKYSLFEFF